MPAPTDSPIANIEPTEASPPIEPDHSERELEEKAEQAETEAALERDLEGTFPTSDPLKLGGTRHDV